MAENRIVRQNFSNIRQEQADLQRQKIIEENTSNASEVFEMAEKDYASSMMGMKQAPSLITEVCFLPSKGLLYGNALGETLELRAMTTIEERMRLSGENFWSTMSEIMNRCIVNSNFDSKNLTDFDFFAALVKLRIITYGNGYKTNSQCVGCGKVEEITANLDDLIITQLPDDFKEPIEIGPLPRSGDVLGLRFLRVFDHIDILNQVTKYRNTKQKVDLGNPEYTLEMEKMLVSVNGIELDSMARHAYIESMVGMDSSYFHKEVNKLFFGVHRIGTGICSDENCNSATIYQIAPDEEFFRASFAD